MGTFIDYKHNKIVAETASEAFVRALECELLPLLKTRYGDSLLGVQMYEDFVSDNFKYDGEWYYPFTAVTENGAERVWVKWKLSRAAFKTPSPYAFTGERVGFELCEEVPRPFVEKLSGRAFYFEDGVVRLNIESAVSDPLFLSGKYSQTFVDEMARSLTPLIEQTMGVVGIADSTIELTLVFSPESYLEHTSERVTYRRLLISDKTSAPRDLWVKWTSLTSARAYSVSDAVSSADIRFELGEDVSQKIREKEYRFLLGAGKDKYHIAMGRKNVTGWRELIKRALRKGELTKVDREDESVSVSANQLVVIPEEQPAAQVKTPVDEPVVVFDETPGEADVSSEEDPVALALKALGISADEYRDDEEDYEEEETDELDDFYGEDGSDSTAGGVRAQDEDEERELDELTKMAMAAIKAARADESEVAEDEPEEDYDDIEAEEELEAVEEEPTVISLGDDYDETESDEEEVYEDTLESEDEPRYTQTVVPEEPTAEEYEDGEEIAAEEEDEPVVETAPVSAEEAEAKLRRELEAKIRLEYESEARRKAEEEAERLRREHDRLKEENERLQREARLDELKKQQLEEARRSETEKLRAEIEAQMRAEARERERLAEAARAAVEEQRRLEAQRLREERERFEEEKRRDEIRRREEEKARIEAERAREAERIRRETEERVRAEYEAELAKAKSAAPAPEEKKEAESEPNPNYTYTSKMVKLLFRRSVDPNITARIYEIIKATLEYYGKDKIYLKIKATVPNNETVNLEFVQIPMEEMDLLSNIIKVLGNSGLGIAKAIVE